MLDDLAGAVADAGGFRDVVYNVYRPETDDYEAKVLRGTAEVRDALEGSVLSREMWMALLDSRFKRGGAYLIPEGMGDWPADVPVFEPDRDSGNGEHRWRSGDALLIPVCCPRGSVLGLLSVDRPSSGTRPDAAQLLTLSELASAAGVALSKLQQLQ